MANGMNKANLRNIFFSATLPILAVSSQILMRRDSHNPVGWLLFGTFVIIGLWTIWKLTRHVRQVAQAAKANKPESKHGSLIVVAGDPASYMRAWADLRLRVRLEIAAFLPLLLVLVVFGYFKAIGVLS